jgi:hypothetical protein
MSSTGRKADRVSFDDYPTPISAIDSFLAMAELPQGGRWLEPCAGEGRIIERVQTMHSTAGTSIEWHAWEIQEKYRAPLEALGAKVWIGDMLARSKVALKEVESEQGLAFPYPFDVVITNPPYDIAMDVLRAARYLAPIVVLLLRRNFIGSVKRHAYLSQNMPDEYLLTPRPSFIWSHAYKLRCSTCGLAITHRVKTRVGEPSLPKGSVFPMLRCERCSTDGKGLIGRGNLSIEKATITKNDSIEYAWKKWTPDSGPVGTTRMLPLQNGGEGA